MDFDVQQWHLRGAVGLGIVASVCYLASLVTSEMSGETTAYFVCSLATVAAAYALGTRWPLRRMLLLWPVLDCVGMIGASIVAPDAATLTLAALVIGFLYVGFTQPQGGSLLLMPLAIVAYLVVLDLPSAQLAIRLPLTVIVWIAVSELPAWLISSLAEAREALVRLAGTDALTGLPNRREWDAWLDNLADGGDPFAVLLVDLDHFKQYNDRHGHLAGDDLLIEFGQRLRAAAGSAQVVARWGGEEFAIALLGADQQTAETVATRVLAVVPDAQTCSIGIAVHRTGDTAHALLERADKALYVAKSAGRAQLSVA